MFRASFVVLSLATTLAACGSSDPGIVWSQTSTIERRVVIENAAQFGTLDVLQAFRAARSDSAATDSACPAATRSGATITYTGNGCIAPESGNVYSGVITIRRMDTVGLYENLELDFDGFEMHHGAAAVAIDGSFAADHIGSDDPAVSTASVHLDLVRDGVALRFDVDVSCDDVGRCTAAEGSTGAIEGRGLFAFAIESVSSGTGYAYLIHLRGDDELAISDPNANTCMEYAIDGDPAGSVCAE